MSEPPIHFVAIPWLLFSHARQLLALVATLIQEKPNLTFTIFSYKLGVPGLHAELKRAPLDDEARSRIRIIGIVEEETTVPGVQGMGEAWFAIKTAFPPAYQAVSQGEGITCTFSKTTFDYTGIPPPSMVVYDMFIPGACEAVREVTPNAKLVHFFITSAGSFIRHYGPTALGGLGEWEEYTTNTLKQVEGKTLEEVAIGFERPFSGKVFENLEGVPLYDNEIWPQDFPAPPIIGPLWESTKQAMAADAAMLCTTTTFERKCTAALKAWYKEKLGKDLFLVGPRFYSGVYPPEQSKPEGDDPVFKFLDSKPARSVWLISFGTVFFPVNAPHYYAAVLKVLLKNDIPFIVSRAAATFTAAAIPPELEKEIADRGAGLIVDFVPQQEALKHPSMGAFVTHGGTSSMWESILGGVVGIFWPFFADQPMHAAYLSTKLDIGFELLQVRTGKGAIDPLRGGHIEGTEEAVAGEVQQIINDLQGDVGARKRSNLERVRRETFESLADGGDSQLAVQEFLQYGINKAAA